MNVYGLLSGQGLDCRINIAVYETDFYCFYCIEQLLSHNPMDLTFWMTAYRISLHMEIDSYSHI